MFRATFKKRYGLGRRKILGPKKDRKALRGQGLYKAKKDFVKTRLLPSRGGLRSLSCHTEAFEISTEKENANLLSVLSCDLSSLVLAAGKIFGFLISELVLGACIF